MSIHHEVSVPCDSCGQWQQGDDSTTRQRRRDGWLIWRTDDGNGPWRHLCPVCNATGKTTREGERPDAT